GEHAVRLQAEESTSGTGHEARAVADDVEPGPLRGRRWLHRRPHQRWTRKTPTPINNAPIHWRALIGSWKSHFAAPTRTPGMLQPVGTGRAMVRGGWRRTAGA